MNIVLISSLIIQPIESGIVDLIILLQWFMSDHHQWTSDQPAEAGGICDEVKSKPLTQSRRRCYFKSARTAAKYIWRQWSATWENTAARFNFTRILPTPQQEQQLLSKSSSLSTSSFIVKCVKRQDSDVHVTTVAKETVLPLLPAPSFIVSVTCLPSTLSPPPSL